MIQFYQMCIQATKAHLSYHETFPQAGLALAYFCVTCIGRHGDIDYALQVHQAAKNLLDLHGDAYTIGRGLAISGLFVSHLSEPLRENFDNFYDAIEDSLISGDKHQMLNSVGGVAALKLYCGDNIVEVDSYCSTAAEDFGDWTNDLRGGTVVLGCR